jgi:hypothetical protein
VIEVGVDDSKAGKVAGFCIDKELGYRHDTVVVTHGVAEKRKLVGGKLE